MPLADRIATQQSTPIVVMTLITSEVELAAAGEKVVPSDLEIRFRFAFDINGKRHAARLSSNVGGQ